MSFDVQTMLARNVVGSTMYVRLEFEWGIQNLTLCSNILSKPQRNSNIEVGIQREAVSKLNWF